MSPITLHGPGSQNPGSRPDAGNTTAATIYVLSMPCAAEYGPCLPPWGSFGLLLGRFGPHIDGKTYENAREGLQNEENKLFQRLYFLCTNVGHRDLENSL